MRTVGGSVVIHVVTGRRLDISAPDSNPLIAEVYGNCHREPPTLICECGTAVYLTKRKRNDIYHMWAITFNGSHSHSGEPAHMSDEHKRQAEYTVRASQDAGWPADFEVWLAKTRRKPDAVIHGVHEVGIEIQRSHVTARTAVKRTADAIQAGLATSVWFSDRSSSRPPWFHRVPSVAMNDRPWPWDELPPKRAVTVTGGAKILLPLKCDSSNDYIWPVCPIRKRGHCGKWHMRHEPWFPLTVDDIAERVPGGDMVAMRYLDRNVFLVPPESLTKYEEITGYKAELLFAPAAEMRLRDDWSRDENCHHPVEEMTRVSPEIVRPIPGVCIYGCADARLYPGGWRCDAHQPGTHHANPTDRRRPFIILPGSWSQLPLWPEAGGYDLVPSR